MPKPIRHGSKWRIRWRDHTGKRRSAVFEEYRQAQRALTLRLAEALAKLAAALSERAASSRGAPPRRPSGPLPAGRRAWFEQTEGVATTRCGGGVWPDALWRRGRGARVRCGTCPWARRADEPEPQRLPRRLGWQRSAPPSDATSGPRPGPKPGKPGRTCPKRRHFDTAQGPILDELTPGTPTAEAR